ncbi:MAG: EFR1 family ferrodoxin [Pseudomonadota bacterium]
MATRIYYFTGTGNSLWAARTLAERLGAAEPTPVVRALAEGSLAPTEERIGLVCPVYMYRLPYLVRDFLDKLQAQAPLFVVLTGGGDAGDAFVHIQRQCAARGLDLGQGLFCPVVSNYTPFGPAPEPARQAELLAAATARLEEIAGVIERGERVVETAHSALRAWLHPGLLYRLGYKYIPVTDKGFRVDPACNACGLCARVCPVDNIALVEGHPTWKNACQQCLACMQWCPTEAIQVKEKTRGLRRYHHPEVKVRDLLAQKG